MCNLNSWIIPIKVWPNRFNVNLNCRLHDDIPSSRQGEWKNLSRGTLTYCANVQLKLRELALAVLSQYVHETYNWQRTEIEVECYFNFNRKPIYVLSVINPDPRCISHCFLDGTPRSRNHPILVWISQSIGCSKISSSVISCKKLKHAHTV